MLVKSTKQGFIYGVFRKVGESFDLTDTKHFSSKWMVEVKSEAPEIKPEPKKKKAPKKSDA